MAKKGREKNTDNKAKHTKLLNRKKNKKREEKMARERKLKELNRLINQKKQNESLDKQE